MEDADTGLQKRGRLEKDEKRCSEFKKRKCTERGCKEKLKYGMGNFCLAHKGKCIEPGCTRLKGSSTGYCKIHCAHPVRNTYMAHLENKAEEHKRAYETVQRLKRKADLRRRHFDAVLAKQGGQCAKSFVTCEVTGDGYATHTCTWGNKQLRPGAADLDHVVPLADGGTNDEANLQVLCKCCHGLKTECETYTRKIRRIREEGKAEREARERSSVGG